MPKTPLKIVVTFETTERVITLNNESDQGFESKAFNRIITLFLKAKFVLKVDKLL